MRKKHSQLLKAFVLTLCAGGALWTANELRYQHQRKEALAQQLTKIEAVKAEVAKKNAQEQEQYQQALAQWRSTSEQISERNQRRLERWRANRIEVRTVEVAEAVAPAVVEPSPYITHSNTQDGAVVAAAPAPAPPPPQTVTRVVEVERPPPLVIETPPPPEPPKPTVLEISAEGIKIELQEDTSWQTVLQLLVLLLVGYGGIRVINKYTESEPKAA